jgi:hypothetical protein
MATKSAQWQAAFRQRRREAGLKAVTVWLPKEGVAILAHYPGKERGEVITRALRLLEFRCELTSESRGQPARTDRPNSDVRDDATRGR